MSYRVIQKIRNNYYLYEVESTWDRGKRKPIQHRKYIGKCDPNGVIVSYSKRGMSPERSKEFGSYYSLLEIATDSGIYSDLVRIFGEKDADLIMTMAIIRVIRPGPLRQILNQIDDSFLPELFGMDVPTLKDLSSLLSTIGGSDILRERFSLLRKTDDSITVYDIIHNDIRENRDSYFYCAECRTASLPKRNIFVSYSGSLPFHLRLCPSNITDIGSVLELKGYLNSMGLEKVEFVMSPTSYNPLNIRDMIDSGTMFTIVLPSHLAVVQDMLEEASRHLTSSIEPEDYNGYSVKAYESSMTIENRHLRSIILEEESRRYEEATVFLKRASDFEQYAKGLLWYDGIMSDIERSPYSDVVPYFSVMETDGGNVKVERLHDRIMGMRDRCGKLVIITTSNQPWREVLAKCKKRDWVNSTFATLGNDVESRAKFIPDTDASLGMLNVELIAAMIRDELLKRLRSDEDTKRMWSHDFISELGKLKISRINGRWMLNVVTPEQEHLMKVVRIIPPQSEYPGEMDSE